MHAKSGGKGFGSNARISTQHCKGKRLDGEPCQGFALADTARHKGYCVRHTPARQTTTKAKGVKRKVTVPKDEPIRPVIVDHGDTYEVGIRRPERARAPLEHKPKQIHLVLQGRMAMLARGEISVEDMDDEEIARMQFRDRNGGWSGQTPAAVPRELIDEMRKEFFKRMNAHLTGMTPSAMHALQQIVNDSKVSASDRLKAVNMILERTIGKVPDKMEISTGDKPFEVLLSGGIDRTRRPVVINEDGEVERD